MVEALRTAFNTLHSEVQSQTRAYARCYGILTRHKPWNSWVIHGVRNNSSMGGKTHHASGSDYCYYCVTYLVFLQVRLLSESNFWEFLEQEFLQVRSQPKALVHWMDKWQWLST